MNLNLTKDKQEIMDEIEIAKMLAKEMDKLWKSYALIAKQERELKQAQGFMECESYQEVIDSLYPWCHRR